MKAENRYVVRAEASLFDSQDRLEQLGKMGDPLAALAAVLDWDSFTPVLERIPRTEPRA